MSKFHPFNQCKTDSGYLFVCPGCGTFHYVISQGTNCPVWFISGIEPDNPTVSPSIRVGGRNAQGPTVCHSFVRDGKIQYLNDCTHELTGQTVEIPDFDDEWIQKAGL